MKTTQSIIGITGQGVASCAGVSSEALWSSAVAGQTGISEGVGKITPLLWEEMHFRVRALPYASILEELHAGLPGTAPIFLACYSIAEAMRNAGWNDLRETDGLILATTTGQIPRWDNALIQYLRNTMDQEAFHSQFQHQPLGALLAEVRSRLGFRGRHLLITSACSASTQAIALGAQWLRQNRVERCLVGGVEVLCDLTLNGFKSLQLLRPELAAPFDESRTGINLSEASAFLCLEKNPSQRLAEISGYGLTSDGYHMTAPQPDGEGCYQAMRLALRSSGLEPGAIDWVHAHGTGSLHNDLSEGTAIHRLFGRLFEPPSVGPWVSSTKRIHGHALGASGVLETVLCVEALGRQRLLKTAGLKHPDPKIPLKHPTENLVCSLSHILKNTLGFGGTNASLVLSRWI